MCNQRLSAARSESQGPELFEIGGTRQSGMGTEGVRLLWSLHHHCCHRGGVHGYQAGGSTESRGTRTRGSISGREASVRGTEHPYVRTSCACPPTPLDYRSGQGVSSGRDGSVGGVVRRARSQCWVSICYLCVGVNWWGVSVV